MSTPSFFSRLYEQANAFSITSNNLMFNCPSHDTDAEELVSQCLDLFELIFILGHEIHVIHISPQDIQRLSQSRFRGHQLLVSIITEDMQQSSLNNISDLYLFSWKDIVLGGISPMTVLYAGHNVKYGLSRINVSIKGFGGNELFKDITPLYRRGNKFKEFMYIYSRSFVLPQPLSDYIDLSMRIDNVNLPIWLDPTSLEATFDILRDNYSAPVGINGIPLFSAKRVIDSDDTINPNRPINGLLPLVLSEDGLFGARHNPDSLWNPHPIKIPADIAHVPLEGRILPEFHIRYPYIVVDDLLENKIIQLPTEIDSRYFLTCSQEMCHYLLPIKKPFFKYFTIEDLQESLSIRELDEEVEVKLQVPVRGGHVEYHRVYQKEDIVQMNLNLAITPLYSLQDETYHLFCSKDKSVEIQIEHSEDFGNYKDVAYTQRHLYNEQETGCYTIKQAWNCISVHFFISSHNEKVSGMVFPRFRQVPPKLNECVFMVDISDTYTTISYKTNHDNYAVNPLCLDRNEDFLGILCDADDDFKAQLDRYFIGRRDSTKTLSVFRNVLSITGDVLYDPTNGRVLENSNIAFGYYDFPNTVGNEMLVYPSTHNLRHDTSNQEYFRIYCEELLFLMKQIAVKQYHRTTFDIIIAMPSHLVAVERNIYRHIWDMARQTSGTDICNDTFFLTDSFPLVANVIHSMPVYGTLVNIHIDSNHTLISLYDYKASIKTLCVDMGIANLFQNSQKLFGDDEDYVYRLSRENIIPYISSENANALGFCIHQKGWSLFDVLEYLSIKDEKIRGPLNGHIRDVVAVFLFGIFYYLGRYFDEFNITPQPIAIAFSGLGAKYIEKCVGETEEIENLFEKFIFLFKERIFPQKNDHNNLRQSRVLFYNTSHIISNGLTADARALNLAQTFGYYYGISRSFDTKNDPLLLEEVKDMNVRDSIAASLHGFVGILDLIRRDVRFLDLGFSFNNIELIMEVGYRSVNECIREYMGTSGSESECKEALFFLSLKHGLYEWFKHKISCF